jgi:hypothetical protein
MSQATQELKAELRKNLDTLRTLRDEIRVQVHLAGMEVKDAWNNLEPKLFEAEKLVEEVTEASRHRMNEILKKFQEFQATLP